MNCLTCGVNNPSTIRYCQKCGAKLDLTADEIADTLVVKAKQEAAKSTEFHVRHALVFSCVLFLVMLTLLVIAGGAPEDVTFVPSVTGGTKYLEVDYTFEGKLPKVAIPLEPQKRNP